MNEGQIDAGAGFPGEGGRLSVMTVEAAALLPVTFQDQTLFILDHQGEPFTPMRPIVDGMGLDWSSQFAKLRANQARWGVAYITTPSRGGAQASLCLPVRKLPAFFATIHASRVAPELRERIRRYQLECDDVLWEYWRERVVVPAGARPAIDDTPDPITPAVRAAIERRAHILSLSQYDQLRDALTAAVRFQTQEGAPDIELVELVEQAAADDSALAVVPRDILWRLTTGIACLELIQQRLMADLQALEAATDCPWYGRDADPGRTP